MKLTELVYQGIQEFSKMTDCSELMFEKQLWYIVFAIVGVSLCFLGFHIYRGYMAFVMYLSVVVISCILWKSTSDWGDLVAGFSVVGCVIGYLGFRWKLLGATLLPGILATIMVYAGCQILIIAILAGVVVSFLSYGLPVLMIKITTALFGTYLCLDSVLQLQTDTHIAPALTVAVTMLVTSLGIAIQHMTTQKQSLFTESKRSWAKKLNWNIKRRDNV